MKRFNGDGIASFRSLLEAARSGSEVDTDDLIANADLVEDLPVDLEVDILAFSSRLEAGRYFYDLLETDRRHLGDIERDQGLWAWLSAAWFKHLAGTKPDGTLAVGKDHRWIPEDGDYRSYYRHLLAGPYRIYRAHADEPGRAMAVLAGSVTAPGEVVEQIASRQEIVSSKSLMEAATFLYFDPAKGATKKGAGDKNKGGARRFASVLLQFDRTWDLSQRNAHQILELLPQEFQRFK